MRKIGAIYLTYFFSSLLFLACPVPAALALDSCEIKAKKAWDDTRTIGVYIKGKREFLGSHAKVAFEFIKQIDGKKCLVNWKEAREAIDVTHVGYVSDLPIKDRYELDGLVGAAQCNAEKVRLQQQIRNLQTNGSSTPDLGSGESGSVPSP